MKRTDRIQLMLNAEELDALDEWRFEMRMPSRAAAMRALMRLGLKLDLEREDLNMDPRTVSSSRIGVVDDVSGQSSFADGINALPLDAKTAALAKELAELRGSKPTDAVHEACAMALEAWREKPAARQGRLRVVDDN
ncbi:hypothetical protein OCH7691_03659 [Oceanibacterium hippocampi]|uniref:Uncharacterized protein n=2 Tax=Oceanibacterium hippocampi TaxID=745714 RepID=A0A1Y5TVE9_9PROT|nr:hypothetical protein OCH7691_03659 [Oceanibacterium hippocampi]